MNNKYFISLFFIILISKTIEITINGKLNLPEPTIERIRSITISLENTNKISHITQEGFYDYITNAQLTGVETPHYKSYQMDSVTIELVDGDLFCVETGAVIFTPSKGLGFKFK